MILSINASIFAYDPMENWTASNIAIQFPYAIAFGDSFNYMYFSFGAGMRIKTVADLYLHPSLGCAMIFETKTVTDELFGNTWETEEMVFLSKAAFRIAFEYTVYKYTALRSKGPYRYLTYLNPLVRVYGDLGPIFGLTYADGVILDTGINWREDNITSAFSIQYNIQKKGVGFLMSVGYAF